MPATARSTHPTGLGITFTEADHTYIDDNGQHYTSGTSVLKLVKPVFDPDGVIAQSCADREGITVDQIKAKWSAKGSEACRLGTRSHEYAEDLLLQQPLRHQIPEDNAELARFNAIHAMVSYIQEDYTFLAAEQIVFSPALWISGTIDLLVVCHKSKTVWVLDWKTNASIDRSSKYNNIMLDPLTHLDDCNFIHYALQLGLYRHIIMREGYLQANGLDGYKVLTALLHVTPEKVLWCNTPLFEQEVRDMVIRHVTNIPWEE